MTISDIADMCRSHPDFPMQSLTLEEYAVINKDGWVSDGYIGAIRDSAGRASGRYGIVLIKGDETLQLEIRPQ